MLSAAHLAHPEWWMPLVWGLLVLLLVVGAAAGRARLRRARLLPGGGRVAHAALRSDAALLVAALAIGLALLGPRIGKRAVRVPSSGVDVVLALDVSRSMDARDVPPSRLARARRAAAGLLARLEPTDRVGLVAYAGVGVLLAPLTPDREVLLELLSGLDTDLLAPGSNLASGVRAALGAFESGSARPRVVVVLGDGEDPQRHGELAAAAAVRASARVLAIGFGSEVGATVPDHGVSLVDRGGRTVVSRRDLDRLARLTSATDGRVFPADVWGQLDLDAVVREIRRDAGSAPGERVVRRVSAVRVLPFAALAFGILCLEGLPRPRLRRRPRRRRASLPGVAAVCAVLLLALPSPASDASLASLEARVREQPEDPAALIALGAAHLERGQRDAALRLFLAAAVHARAPHATAIAYFDVGVAQLARGELEAARDAFLDALAFDPNDEQARFDLEWTLVALEQHPPSTSPPPREPKPAKRAAPAPSPKPETPKPETKSPPEPAPEAALSPRQQQRLLERIEDDPSQALRSAARETRRPAGGGGEAPVW